MAADSHIEIGDYVLLHATKRVLTVSEGRRGTRPVQRFLDTSTWTWKIRGEVRRQVNSSIHVECQALNLGAEPTATSAGCGLKGILAAQRERPLFAGVRNQVIDLHRYALEAWAPYAAAACLLHRTDKAELPSVRDLMRLHLPTMSQQRFYTTPPETVRTLLAGHPSKTHSPRCPGPQPD